MTRDTAAHQLPGRNLKRSFIIHGRKTSTSLEQQFYDGAKFMAAFRGISLKAYIEDISDNDKGDHCNLASAIRLRVLRDYQAMAKLTNELRAGAEMREELSAPLAPH